MGPPGVERHEAVWNWRHLHQLPDRRRKPGAIEAALGKSIRRLGEVKSKWDAKNVFRTNRNIRPA
jgi:hypothetical protein